MEICLEADLHVHSIASGHGFSTITEIANAAAQRDLKMVALTDHGLNMPGGPNKYYFYKLLDLPKVINGVEVLKGVEANILDTNGTLDVPVRILESLDIVLAGFHGETGYRGVGVEENTRAMISAIKNPFVDIIVHPGNPQYPVDIEKIVHATKQTGKILEINNHSFLMSRPGSSSFCQEILRKAAQNGAYLTINSDAHNSFEVGKTENAIEAAKKAGIKNNQILNTSTISVREYLRQSKQNLKKTS